MTFRALAGVHHELDEEPGLQEVLGGVWLGGHEESPVDDLIPGARLEFRILEFVEREPAAVIGWAEFQLYGRHRMTLAETFLHYIERWPIYSCFFSRLLRY